jgi:endonuclease III
MKTSFIRASSHIIGSVKLKHDFKQLERPHFVQYLKSLSTILSAQCTDKRVNLVTPVLFKKYRTAAAYADSSPADLEKMIRSTGFFRSKTKSIRAAAAGIVADYGGRVPDSMAETAKTTRGWEKNGERSSR